MTPDPEFAAYLERRWQASDAFVAGDPGPLSAVSTGADPASIFGPSGTVVAGAAAVDENNAAGSARFTGADRNDVEVLHSGSDGDLGWWAGIQRSVVRVAGQDDPAPMDLRVTELYRREDSGWALFHRHADLLKE